MQLFLDKTDATHYVTMVDILNHLNNNGIVAERKSVYADIEALKLYGLDIKGFQEKGTYFYHLVNRKFELVELKLLVDAVQSSKFITARKSNELIKKIESFGSHFEAKELQRQVFVTNRVKKMNESIYYNVDTLHAAINLNKKITFQYFQWTVDKKTELKRDGVLYKVSPWALMWNNENYYMVAYDSDERKIKHFRVDKMLHIVLIEENRDGKEHFERIDMAVYSNKMFGMFGGTQVIVKMQCNNKLVGVIIERFGKEVPIVPMDEEHFTINVEVEVSKQFLAWVIGLGPEVKIVAPEDVVEQMR
jgi:predicted DNA-binding transcriptional regulator YafY